MCQCLGTFLMVTPWKGQRPASGGSRRGMLPALLQHAGCAPGTLAPRLRKPGLNDEGFQLDVVLLSMSLVWMTQGDQEDACGC